MNKSFSQALKEYYLRRGNKLVFRNGRTLNQLALQMWERLGYREIDPSALSRILAGERLFSPKQLVVFCKILGLNKQEIGKLSQVLEFNLAQKFGFGQLNLKVKQHLNIDSFQKQLKMIQEVRDRGLPLVAYEWSQILEDQVVAHPLLLAKLLIIKTHLVCDFRSPVETQYEVFRITRQLKTLARQLHSQELMAQVFCRNASSLYVAANHSAALKYLSKSLEFSLPPEDKMLCLRESALCLAYLSRTREYERVKKQLLRLLPSYHPYLQYQVLEGLSRAESILGNCSQALEFLAQACNQPEDKLGFIVQIQLPCAAAEIASHCDSLSDKHYLSKIGESGLLVANLHGYARHAKKLEYYLDKTLN